MLETIDDRLSPADFAKLTAQNIGILEPKRAPKNGQEPHGITSASRLMEARYK